MVGKIAQLTNSTNAEIAEQFEVIDFPVRLEFQKVKDNDLLEAYRKKWELHPNEKGILIEMGANGVGILRDIFFTLKDAPVHSSPIKYYFVCGRNEQLKEDLKSFLDSNDVQDTALNSCSVLGFVEARDKNELMNICSLMIGKPGGSTLAEVTKLKLPMFIMHIQKICECGNLERLLEDGLAYQYKPEESLTEQIEKTLKEIETADIQPKEITWERLVLQKLLILKHHLQN